MKKSFIRHVLIVDDCPETLVMINDFFELRGCIIFSAPGVFEAIRILESNAVDLVIIDVKVPEISGINLIKYIREKFKDIEVVIISDSTSLKSTAQKEKLGGEEYLVKPLTIEALNEAVKRAGEKLQMRKTMKKQLHKLHSAPFGIIGKSKPIRKILDAIEKTASVSATVLISGESGTGKELAARAIHYCSSRASAPFVPVSLGSIPENLMESELFGHVKGAFTGAFDTRPGFFQTADGGTIFLDDISETPLAMQVKLLRVLQEKEICMVGSRRNRKIDVRILASSNRDLMHMVKNNLFREDLYYRLNVVNIHLPPLRERDDDILLLIQYFANLFAAEFNKPAPKFLPKALLILKKYEWPGNIRELENVVRRLVLMTDEPVIGVPVLNALMGANILRGNYSRQTLAEVEAEHIRKVLADVGNNKTHAAKILDIDRKTLREKLKKANICTT